MKPFALLLLLPLTLSVLACEPRFLLGGIQVREPDMDAWLETLDELGFNTVSITAYTRQGLWDGPAIESQAREDWLVPEIRAAKRRGLRVVLILRVALEHGLEENLFYWHGMIMPRDEIALRAWFSNYEDVVRRWAAVAEAEGVDVLGIGSELNALTATVPVTELPVLEEYYLNAEKQAREHERLLPYDGEIDEQHLKAGWGKTYDSLPRFLDSETEAHRRWAQQVTFSGDLEAINARRRELDRRWRELIASVRQVYGGELTYAANFDQYQNVGFWDALDLIGINAYFPLRQGLARPEDLYPRFEAAWDEILGEIVSFREARALDARQVLFTELGYRFRADSTIDPWAGDGFAVLPVAMPEVGDEGEIAADPQPVATELVIWRERPVDYRERALAVRALRASAARHPELLRGLLYWKLSTQAEHEEIEPFVCIIGPQGADPLQEELLRFVR